MNDEPFRRPKGVTERVMLFFRSHGAIDVPSQKCPNCSNLIEAATHAGDGGAVPEPGNFNVCAYCGDLHVFGPTMRLRVPTADERAAYQQLLAEQPGLARAAEQIRRKWRGTN